MKKESEKRSDSEKEIYDGNPVGQFFLTLAQFKQKSPSPFNGIRIGLLAIILGLIGIGVWYLAQPKPPKIRVSLVTPMLKPLVKDAQPSKLQIRFSGSVAKLEESGKEVKSGIELDPPMVGNWKWVRDNRLEFTPFEDWPVGTEVTVRLSKTLFPEHVTLQSYKESFTTPAFGVSIVSNRYYIDPRDEDSKHISATVKFTHPVDPATFSQRIFLRPYKLKEDVKAFQSRDYAVTVKYDEFFGKAFILSEPLPMPEEDIQMELVIDSGVRSTIRGGQSYKRKTSLVTIPGITNFVKIKSIKQTMVRNPDYRLEQFVVVNSKGRAKVSEIGKYLEAWVLPRDLPASPGIKEEKNYGWWDPSIVGPKILSLSKKLILEPGETESDFASLVSFKINANPGSYVFVRLKKGAPFYGKYNLSKDYLTIFKVLPYPEQLEIMHEGVILSSCGDTKVSIVSQGIKHVRFKIGRVKPDDINHLVSQSNGDLRKIQFINYNFSEDNIVNSYYEIRDLNRTEPGEPNYFSFDFSKYLKADQNALVRNGIFFFEVQGWDPYNNQPLRKKSKRLIMISDLGILVKEGPGNSRDLFVQSIATGFPVSGAKVQVLGKNGIPVLSRTTDQNGHTQIPTLRGYNREKQPTVYTVSKNADLTFMPFRAPGRWLDNSRFDVGGVYGSSDPNKINAYLFSERGIYRPGDKFNIGMIVKTGDWKKELTGTPMEASIEDPRGQEIHRQKYKMDASGFSELTYKTEDSSPTGVYQINLYIINQKGHPSLIGSTTIKVEEFLPDRLNISAAIPGAATDGWISPDKLKGIVTLRNLFGSAAVGNRVEASLILSPGRLWFSKYKDFIFNDPMTRGKSFSEDLPEETTDQNGRTEFNFDLDRFESGTYNLNFSAIAFEKEGGRNVSASARALVSPNQYLIGTKADGDLDFIYKGSKRLVKIIAISPSLKQLSMNNLRFILNEIRHVSVLTELPNGTYAYKSVEKKVLVSSEFKIIPISGLNYSLPTSDPGAYELTISDKNDQKMARLLFSVVGEGNITRSLDRTAELDIKLNKTDYEPGEEIEVYVKAPYTGAGLISIEREKVYAYQWFRSNSNSFIRKIRIPRELEGNGYVNVSFVRSAASREIFMSPLSYGVEPFSISKKARVNKITIDIPDLARSGTIFPIRYKTDKPAKIAVFAVDEGILQVAKYSTPDPLAHFFKKQALQVRTAQILDLILPEFSIFQSLGAMGGGSGFEEIVKNLNPFKRKRNKPVVYWSGILDSDKKERTLNYTVPDYFNGTLRVMAVAVSKEAIGTFERKSIIRNPFIISPNVPMIAAPGDSFQVSVTVTNMLAGSTENLPLVFNVTGSSGLMVHGMKHELRLSENADTTINFQVKALDLPGEASLKFNVSGGGEKTALSTHLSVRPAVPYRTFITTGFITDDDIEVKTPRRMYKDFRVLEAASSFLPVGLSHGLKLYLDQYPHACTEQVLSQSFPYLYLKRINGFGVNSEDATEKVAYAVKVLQSRQNIDGKFGFWAANSITSDFITVYGMHFLTEARLAGYYVPDKLYRKTLNALKDIVKARYGHFNEIRTQAYAIYILTRNEILTSNQISTLRKSLDEKYKYWKQDIAGAYLASAYLLMHLEKEGNSILSKTIENKFEDLPKWDFCNEHIQQSRLLYLLAKHAPDKLSGISGEILISLANYIRRNRYTTISSSFLIMGLSEYTSFSGAPGTGQVLITQILKNEKREKLMLPEGKFPKIEFSPGADALEIKNQRDIPLYYQVMQAGYDRQMPKEKVEEGLEVYREYSDSEGNRLSKVNVGAEVVVHLKFRSLSKNRIYNVAIVDMLPAGLEIISSSVRESNYGKWKPDNADIREDRLVIYGTVTTNITEFTYSARAINKGVYTVPPVYGESMYDRKIYGLTPNAPIIIE